MRSLLFTLLCVVAVQGEAAQSENDLLDQLRADYAALLKARTEFEELEKACDASIEEQADFAVWIKQLSEQFAETCQVVSSHSTKSIPADIPCGKFTSAVTSPAGIDIQHETTDAEKTAAMVGQFNDSLGEFDEKLLREQDRVKAQKPLSSSASSGGGAAAGADDESGGESAQDSANSEAAHEGQQSGQQGGDQTATGARGTSSSGNQSTAPADIPDGSDDDVIARQLREAAEKEADPELKKKLWEEYRRYKKG